MTNTIEIENLNISDLDIPTDETLQEVATACENIATSSESIATSCDNVATSCSDLAKDTTLQSTNTALGSLATDATLQATNTALGSISGSLSGFATDTTLQAVKGSIDSVASAEGTLNTTLGAVAKDTTLQATNTALASLMADTTGQSIASAISGLGQALGSDRALIDGSNIANPSAFRNAIGIELTSTTTGANGGTVHRWGNIVSINFQGTTGTNMGYVPSGYRPQSVAERTIVFVEKYNGSTLTNRYYALLAVESNGNISCSYASSYGGTSFPSAKDANHKIYGNITYLIADND